MDLIRFGKWPRNRSKNRWTLWARGYTPSIYSRCLSLNEPEILKTALLQESITFVLQKVLMMSMSWLDTVRGIIDGHIVLSRKIVARNHHPAIDVLGSVSRLMNDIADKGQLEAAGKMRNLMSIYDANYDLVNIGAYKKVETNKPLMKQSWRWIK